MNSSSHGRRASPALAFVAFCLASSSVYIINDLLDAEVDRQHPVKRSRPIAAGEIGTGSAIGLAVALTLAALGLAATINGPFTIAIAAYIALVHVLFDRRQAHRHTRCTMLVAVGFVLRAVGGALAIQAPSSDWFVLCTFFAALFLALSKRRAEMLSQDGGSAGHRRRDWRVQRVEALATYTATAIAATAITYSLYAIDSAPTVPAASADGTLCAVRVVSLPPPRGDGEIRGADPRKFSYAIEPSRSVFSRFFALSLASIYLDL